MFFLLASKYIVVLKKTCKGDEAHLVYCVRKDTGKDKLISPFLSPSLPTSLSLANIENKLCIGFKKNISLFKSYFLQAHCLRSWIVTILGGLWVAMCIQTLVLATDCLLVDL